MYIDIKELQKVLVEIMEDYREKTKGVSSIAPIYVGAIAVLNKLLIWVSEQQKQYDQEEVDMSKIREALKVELVSAEDIPGRRQGSEVKEQILEWVRMLEDAYKKKGKTDPTPALKIVSGMTYGNLNNRVAKLRQEKAIPEYITVASRKGGQEFWLVRKEG